MSVAITTDSVQSLNYVRYYVTTWVLESGGIIPVLFLGWSTIHQHIQ